MINLLDCRTAENYLWFLGKKPKNLWVLQGFYRTSPNTLLNPPWPEDVLRAAGRAEPPVPHVCAVRPLRSPVPELGFFPGLTWSWFLFASLPSLVLCVADGRGVNSNASAYWSLKFGAFMMPAQVPLHFWALLRVGFWGAFAGPELMEHPSPPGTVTRLKGFPGAPAFIGARSDHLWRILYFIELSRIASCPTVT